MARVPQLWYCCQGLRESLSSKPLLMRSSGGPSGTEDVVDEASAVEVVEVNSVLEVMVEESLEMLSDALLVVETTVEESVVLKDAVSVVLMVALSVVLKDADSVDEEAVSVVLRETVSVLEDAVSVLLQVVDSEPVDETVLEAAVEAEVVTDSTETEDDVTRGLHTDAAA
jgi:hypothetical protein